MTVQRITVEVEVEGEKVSLGGGGKGAWHTTTCFKKVGLFFNSLVKYQCRVSNQFHKILTSYRYQKALARLAVVHLR